MKLPNGKAGAEFDVKLDRSVGDVPVDTTFTIRPRSPLGLKYLEMDRGDSDAARPAGPHLPGRPRPRCRSRSTTSTGSTTRRPGRAYAATPRASATRSRGAGMALNEAIGELPRLFGLHLPGHAQPRRPAHADRALLPRAGRRRADRGADRRVNRPTCSPAAANTFEALSRDTEALKETISRSHPLFQAGIESFPVQRPFLTESARLARVMRPVARELRPTLPSSTRALARGIPVTRKSVGFYEDLKPTLAVAARPGRGPGERHRAARPRRDREDAPAAAQVPRPVPDGLQLLELLVDLPRRAPVSRRRARATASARESKSAAPQTNNPGSMGAVRAGQRRGLPARHGARAARTYHLHSTPYNHAITDDGEADCENGQRGYLRRYTRFPRAAVPDPDATRLPGRPGADLPRPRAGARGPDVQPRAAREGARARPMRRAARHASLPGRAHHARRDRGGRRSSRSRASCRSATTTRSRSYFEESVNVKERQPVRIAGVDVGKVVEGRARRAGRAAGRGHDAHRGRRAADPPGRAGQDPPAACSSRATGSST